MRVNQKAFIITFFGPDGAGKSTCISCLILYLKDRGFKIYGTWVCVNHLFAWLLCRVFVKFGHYVWRPNEKSPFRTRYPSPEVYKSKLNMQIWLFAELVSILPTILLKVYLPKFLRRIVVVERYIPGILADLVYASDRSFLNSFSARLLLRLCNNVIFVYVDADYETVVKRRGLQAEPRDYYETQQMVYRLFANDHNCLVINAGVLDIEAIRELIIGYISNKQQIMH